VHRVWTSRCGRGRLPGRALDYLTFYFFTGLALLRLASRGDVVVAKTDPPLLSLVAWPTARLKGAKLVNWLQDIFPEVAGAVGMGWARGWLGRLLASLRDRSLRAAHMNVVLGSRMQRYLISRGVETSKLRVIPNWADGELIRAVKPEDNQLRREWGLDGKFVVGYSGNMGRVHEFETILRAARALSGDSGIVVLFIGDGAQKKWLVHEVAQRALSNIRFLPYQPSERLAASLSVPDVHLISLRLEVEGFVVPSKFYGITASGRPAIFVGSSEGELAGIIREVQCGVVIEVGDDQGLAAAIRELKNDNERLSVLGDNARRVFEKRFDRSIALAAWENVLCPSPAVGH
jgi:colanic acid biosynthesis glycosyl transferase WcaI